MGGRLGVRLFSWGCLTVAWKVDGQAVVVIN